MSEAALRKENRKLQDTINRFWKLIPGSKRIWELDHKAAIFDAFADIAEQNGWIEWDIPALRDDALFLRRLAWDLGEMRDALRIPLRGTRGRDWLRGDRP